MAPVVALHETRQDERRPADVRVLPGRRPVPPGRPVRRVAETVEALGARRPVVLPEATPGPVSRPNGRPGPLTTAGPRPYDSPWVRGYGSSPDSRRPRDDTGVGYPHRGLCRWLLPVNVGKVPVWRWTS